MKLAPLVLCCACATTRLLPLPAASQAVQPQPLPVHYEKTRFFFFTSQETDGLLQGFQSGGPVVLASAVRPQTGLYASPDDGASWSFAPMDGLPQQTLFDPADPKKIYLRMGMRVSYSSDGGHTWNASQPFAGPVDALAMGQGGAVLAGGQGALAISEDGARTWRTLPIESKWRVRSIAAAPGALYISVHVEPDEPRDLLQRFAGLLDYGSDEAVSALALADAHDSAPRPIAWDGARGDGIYVSHDNGGLWKKTGLSLDAYVAVHEGALYAVAADPILQAAALVRRYPDLAALADRQMHGDRADPEGLKAACRFPGRDKLLQGPVSSALVFRSDDAGGTWMRAGEPPLPLALALREVMERSQWVPTFFAPQQRPKPQYQRQRGPQRGSQYRGMEATQRIGIPSALRGAGLSGETVLAFVDPLRLLARFNGGAPLSGVSGDVAWVATEARWNALAGALAEQSQSDGEFSLGPGSPVKDDAVAYELLKLHGGAAQPFASSLPTRSAAFPISLAATPDALFALIGSRDAQGNRWRAAFRVAR